MNTRDAILLEARKGAPLKSSDLVRRLGVSRQTVSGHLRRLVEEGLLSKTGSTKNARYTLVETEVAAPASSMPIRSSTRDGGSPRSRWTPVAMGLVAIGAVLVAAMLAPGAGDESRPGARLEPGATAQTALRDTQVIGAEQTLSVGAVRVEAGSEITLKAGEMVSLGEGFTVDEEGALVVEIEHTEAQNLQSEDPK